MNPTLLCLAIAMTAVCTSRGADPTPINLWPGTPPGETGRFEPEHDTSVPGHDLIAGRPIIRLGDVTVPTMTVYTAPADRATGTGIVIFPGGGISILAYDLEGTEVCNWLNSIGVTAVLVKYRVPVRPGREKFAAALEDGQRAVGLVRSRAAEFGIDPNRIGTLGFSAGGGLSARVCASAGAPRVYAAVDAADAVNSRPDFQVLIYPGDLIVPRTLTLSPAVSVTPSTPPTFLAMAQNDPVHVEQVLAYAIALQATAVPMELHVYPTGGHGYGMRPTKHYVTTWPARLADWMRSRRLLEAAAATP